VHGTVLKAFSVLALALASVCAGFFLLLATEKGEPLSLLFEAVSAFATVGLSAGITSSLTPAGKIVIIILMFTGRLGPLTLVSSIGAEKGGKARHRYPAAELPIG
jgi:trk system potassium uptake protein TrkH